jgi:tRNA (guanine-N7-)-methyltransferase
MRKDRPDMTATSEIRSYKLRRGRVTASQAAALVRSRDRYGVPDEPRVLELPSLFGRLADVWLEIGFGMGEATADLAAAEPDRDVLAVDVHTPGVGSLLGRLDELGLTNVRVAETDGVRLLRERLAPGSLAGVRLFFPDPWPKTRHVKRRLVSAPFCDLAASRLRPGGVLHVVTDVPAYAEQVCAVLSAHHAFVLGDGQPPPRMTTRFERQALAAGRHAIELYGVRRAS